MTDLNSIRESAARVLSTQGRAPVLLEGMDDEDVKAIAALQTKDGIAAGAGEQLRLVLVRHYAKHKATDAALEAKKTKPGV